MRFYTSFIAVLASSLLRVQASKDGTLELVKDQPMATFHYATDAADPKNWVGIYDASGGGPDNEQHNSDSLTWQYAPAQNSTVNVDVSKLSSGQYKAYYLAKDGYQWLAQPIMFFKGGSGPVSFYVDRFTTQNGRVGDKFEARVNGLIENAPDSNFKFSKQSGAGWVAVSRDGTLTGTPTGAGNTQVTVLLTGSDGSTATLPVTIPVVKSGSALVKQLNVMSSNMWHGGSQVNGYQKKQAKFITSIGADVIGFQESSGGNAQRVANTLGWFASQGSDVGIISRYPIVETYPITAAGISVRIALDGNATQIIMYNAHLGYTPYGPYDFCFESRSKNDVLNREAQSGRTPQIKEIVDRMTKNGEIANASKVPVLLTGDFNAPSHLDWTESTGKAHCNVGDFPWPSSTYPINAGLVDSYRKIHPDPNSDPGNTWSPIYLTNGDYGNKPEPMDRIDFVYYAGALEPVKSDTLTTGTLTPEPNQQNNEWTSDHKWVMTTFNVLNAKK